MPVMTASQIQVGVSFDFVHLVERLRLAESTYEFCKSTQNRRTLEKLRRQVDSEIERLRSEMARMGLLLPSPRESEE